MVSWKREHGDALEPTPPEFPFVRLMPLRLTSDPLLFPKCQDYRHGHHTLLFHPGLQGRSFSFSLSSLALSRGPPYSLPRQTLWDRGLCGQSFALIGHLVKDSSMSLPLQREGQTANCLTFGFEPASLWNKARLTPSSAHSRAYRQGVLLTS